MSFAWQSAMPIAFGAISLYELSVLVAERTRFESAGVPRVSAVAVGKPSGRRARRHTYATGIMRTRPPAGPRVDQGGDRA